MGENKRKIRRAKNWVRFKNYFSSRFQVKYLFICATLLGKFFFIFLAVAFLLLSFTFFNKKMYFLLQKLFYFFKHTWTLGVITQAAACHKAEREKGAILSFTLLSLSHTLPLSLSHYHGFSSLLDTLFHSISLCLSHWISIPLPLSPYLPLPPSLLSFFPSFLCLCLSQYNPLSL